jgi:hypothetical protein
MQREVIFRLILERPPTGVDFALQKGRGSAYETIQKQRSTGKNLEFEFTLAIKAGDKAAPEFTGPLVHGPPGDRFIYLDIGTYAGQADSCWSRRLKVPLTDITWRMIDPQSVLEARVPGAADDGGPNCGTVKPFTGWKSRQK